MRQAAVLGSPGTKRTAYLEKGAEAAGIRFRLLDWREFPFPMESSWENMFLKIDPPLWDSCCLEELDVLAGDYGRKLQRLAEMGKTHRITFLNRPEGIRALLDKRSCKRRLAGAGIPVTEELDVFVRDEDMPNGGRRFGSRRTGTVPGQEPAVRNPAELLLDAMERHRLFQVFIKPVYGSGAAGTSAFRWQPRSGRMILYTCAMVDPVTGRLVNTKRLRRFTDRRQVLDLVGRLLELDCVAERWYAKAEYDGFSYDLRAVVQDGRMDFLLARLSSGPITNLHLNNHPLKGEELGLPAHVLAETEQLCLRTAACYPELRSMGIDILLEKGSLRPRIIELNGQGDLIYQDIYDKNKIYRHQAEMMKEWLLGNFSNDSVRQTETLPAGSSTNGRKTGKDGAIWKSKNLLRNSKIQ